jgi:hypothetical protein
VALGIQYVTVFVALGIQHVTVFVALGIQHVTRMGLWPAPSTNIFFTLSHKLHDFRNTAIEYKMCVSIFSTKFVQIFFLFQEEMREI